MESNTPRTDLESKNSRDYDGFYTPAFRNMKLHAERLEIELNETHAELDRQMQTLGAIRRMHGHTQ